MFLAAWAGACASGPEPWLEATSPSMPVARASVARLGGIGLSGTALDDRGVLWAVAEHERVLVALERRQGGGVEAHRVPLLGVPAELELESLAWIGSRRFAIGTERRFPRASDLVLLVSLSDRAARVDGEVVLDYRALWGFDAPSNQGIEGLCFADGRLVAAGEPVIVHGVKRYAPVAQRRHGDAAWTPHLVELTSHSGKLSALDCELTGASLYVLGVERHFGITRIVHFLLPLDDGRTVGAALLTELSSRLRGMPNVEGITRQGDQLILMTDHDSLAEAGATESIVVGPFDSDDEIRHAEPHD